MISTALGGELVTTTVEGRERFGVNVRYPRELRSDPQRIGTEVLVPTPSGAQIPLGQLTDISITKGAPSIRTENALLSAYIYVDIRDRDIGSYVREAQQAVQEQVSFPPGYYVTWSGQFEYMESGRAAENRSAVDAGGDLPPAVSELPAAYRDADRHALSAILAGRWRLADVGVGLQLPLQ